MVKIVRATSHRHYKMDFQQEIFCIHWRGVTHPT